MEYGKNDMYVRLDKGRHGGSRAAKKAPAVKKVAEMDMELEVELDVVVSKVEEVIPVPPIIELPAEDGQCSYCITPVMSYTPVQKWGKTYEAGQALERGTIFPELDYPFMGKGGCR